MDTSDPEITFDAQGVCNHCHTAHAWLKSSVKHSSLDAVIAKIKADGVGKDYDCVVGASGGVDSSYVIAKIKELGLRPLVAHLDNGWNSELAVHNIQQILKHLGIDLYTHVIDWEEFKDIQLAFLKASTPDSEVPTDHAIIGFLYDLCLKFNVKYIVTGCNVSTESILPRMWSAGKRDWRYIKSLHKKFGTKRMKTFPHYSLLRYLYVSRIKKVQLVNILNYLSYNKENAIQEMEKKFGWRRYAGKHFESIYTRFFQSYILPKKFGYDKRRAHYSSLIIGGQMTRDEALQKIKEPPCSEEQIQQDREFVIKKLGLTQEQFDSIMTAAPKTIRDYPSYFNWMEAKQAWNKKLSAYGIQLPSVFGGDR